MTTPASIGKDPWADMEGFFDAAARFQQGEGKPMPALPSKWAKVIQRDDLKRCPFCDTHALAQMRLADNTTNMVFRIICGNPFCRVDVATPLSASRLNAEQAWEDRP